MIKLSRCTLTVILKTAECTLKRFMFGLKELVMSPKTVRLLKNLYIKIDIAIFSILPASDSANLVTAF